MSQFLTGETRPIRPLVTHPTGRITGRARPGRGPSVAGSLDRVTRTARSTSDSRICQASPMSDAVRFGLVGYGPGGRVFHAPLLACAEDVEFVGVVTTSPERRDQLAEEH